MGYTNKGVGALITNPHGSNLSQISKSQCVCLARRVSAQVRGFLGLEQVLLRIDRNVRGFDRLSKAGDPWSRVLALNPKLGKYICNPYKTRTMPSYRCCRPTCKFPCGAGALTSAIHVCYNLVKLVKGVYRGLYRRVLWGLLRGILGVWTIARMLEDEQ